MASQGKLIALMKFDAKSQLVEILVQADTNAEEWLISDAVMKLLDPIAFQGVVPVYER